MSNFIRKAQTGLMLAGLSAGMLLAQSPTNPNPAGRRTEPSSSSAPRSGDITTNPNPTGGPTMPDASTPRSTPGSTPGDMNNPNNYGNRDTNHNFGWLGLLGLAGLFGLRHRSHVHDSDEAARNH